MCYICGREYGTTSINIHLKTCKKKWEQAESLKPKRERRPCPEAPQIFDQLTGGGGGGISQQDLAKYNDEAFDNYNKKGLVPCPGCKRTFLPDSLKKHIKGCAPGAKISEEQEHQERVKKMVSKPKGLMCYICGREYGTQSLPIHLKSCKKKWEIE